MEFLIRSKHDIMRGGGCFSNTSIPNLYVLGFHSNIQSGRPWNFNAFGQRSMSEWETDKVIFSKCIASLIQHPT